MSFVTLPSSSRHIDDSTDAIAALERTVSQNPDTKTATCMHGIETVIYLRELIPMRDILVDLHVSFQIIWSREKVSQTIARRGV